MLNLKLIRPQIKSDKSGFEAKAGFFGFKPESFCFSLCSLRTLVSVSERAVNAFKSELIRFYLWQIALAFNPFFLCKSASHK
jgi:hypothetical protein